MAASWRVWGMWKVIEKEKDKKNKEKLKRRNILNMLSLHLYKL
jgi:hypothetical protein